MQTKSIKKLIEIALSNEANIHATYLVGKLAPKQSKFLEKIVGYKLLGTQRLIDTSGIRHTLRKHGNLQEEAERGQIAVTIDDFNKIPLILKEPDHVFYAGKNRLRQDVFVYQKKIGFLYYVAEAIRFSKSGNKLVFQTMYKCK